MPHKIKGTITVEFEMEGAEFQLSVNDVADHMYRLLESRLNYEWQTSQCKPIMSTFKFKKLKN
jgi:hypothetical protein